MPCTGGKLARPDQPMVPCDGYSPPTREEFERDSAQNEREMQQVLDGWCPGCDVALVDRGNLSVCPKGCGTAVRRCGRSDMEAF